MREEKNGQPMYVLTRGLKGSQKKKMKQKIEKSLKRKTRKMDVPLRDT